MTDGTQGDTAADPPAAVADAVQRVRPADDLVIVTTYPSERLATEAAATLLADGGIGAVVERLADRPADATAADPASTDPATPTGASPSTASSSASLWGDRPSVDEPPTAPPSAPAGVPMFAVKVMPQQLRRSTELLGVELPAELLPAEKPMETGTPWKKILILWGIAMLVVPALAFYVSYLFFSR
jgi:hypothetical protein